MIFILCLLHYLTVVALSSDNNYEVGLSADAAFFESCIDLTSLYEAISHLKNVRSTFQQYYHTFKGSNPYLANLGLKIGHNLDSELSSISEKLNQYGFVKDVNFQLNDSMSKFNSEVLGRYKRGAFDFVSEGASYLFGFVSASQYLELKDTISQQFEVVHDHETKLLNAASVNRDHLNKALVTLQSFQREFRSYTKSFADRWRNAETFLGVSIQVSYALSSVQSLVATLGVVRSNADHFYPSRFLSSREELVMYILKLSDSISDISPVFPSTQAESYFRYKISTVSSFDNKICQLLKIPLIGHFGKFNIAHTKDCPSGNVCLSNHLGSAQIPMTQFASCHGVHYHDLPTLCNARPCLVTGDISCVMLNLTSALVATKIPFSATIKCTHKTTVEVQGISVIRIPLNCLIHSQELKIDRVQSMKSVTADLKVIKLPFVIENDNLHVNSQSLGIPIFENSRLTQLILPKLQTSFNTSHLKWRSHLNTGVSFSAGAISILLLFMFTVYLACKFCRNKSPATSLLKGKDDFNLQIAPRSRQVKAEIVSHQVKDEIESQQGKDENDVDCSGSLTTDAELHPFDSRREES